MSVPSTPIGISGTRETSGDSNSRSSPTVERFYEKYHSFKSSKAIIINEAEMKHVFDYFDENHDGLISQEDLEHFLGRLGITTTKEEITLMVNSVDANGDGKVDFSEFASLYQMVANKEEEDEDLKDAFHHFDKDDDGFITPSELQEVLVKLGMDEGSSLTECQRMIQNVDADGNGVVDFVEFKKMMTGDCPQS